jgi:hypothetical protein
VPAPAVVAAMPPAIMTTDVTTHTTMSGFRIFL